MEEIFIDEIIKYKTKRKSKGDYSYGGFYLITDYDMKPIYVGKSIDYMLRLKNHLTNAKSNRGIVVDNIISSMSNARYFLIESYNNLGINFFTRSLEVYYENKYINKFNTFTPNGYNFTYYGNL